MLKKISVLIVFICLGSLSAQTFLGKINPFPSDVKKTYAQTDTLKILAVLVSFQQDNDETTFGNGYFGSIYSKEYGSDIIDPLPHNKAYFESHLEFVKNYYSKVSDGKLNIAYNVLPDTLSLPLTMRNYSPAPGSDDFTNLVNFSKDVWALAAAANPGFNFSDYDLFTIFHAGAGRDISLPGSLSNERDLPSVYLGLEAIRKIYKDPSFRGFPLNDGSYITNSMIIPETESREIESSGETYLFEISINGLLAASIASHFGLPDLFNTETGSSAIGRMGLMDGQSIFAYNGLFPPEPSAWEKIYLGFAEPETITALTNPGRIIVDQSKIIKVPINSTEYYLVENRSRDNNNNGAVITYKINGETFTKIFTKDTSGFYSYEIDSLSGVITDVDEFDWALPGNGILIWHIDENIIDAKLADNKINADEDNRGVDLEEADGIQDIGETFYDIFGNEIIGEGEAADFWFAGNDAELYTNVFGPNTRPNTNSNSGANSLITFSNFSETGRTMSFSVSFIDSIVRPLYNRSVNLPANITSLSSSTTTSLSFNVIADTSLYSVLQGSGELLADSFSVFKPAVVSIGEKLYTIGTYGTTINIYSHAANWMFRASTPGGETITAPPVVQGNDILIGSHGGKLARFSINTAGNIELKEELILGNTAVTKIAANYLTYAVSMNSDVKDLALNNEKEVLLYNDRIEIPDNNVKFSPPGVENIAKLSLADLKNDGENYILYTNGNKLEAVNMAGASAINFPFEDPLDSGFTGIPLAADFQGDGSAEVITYTTDGRIFAIDGRTGKVVKGFPLSAGAALKSTPVIFNYDGQAALAAIDIKNNFYSWKIGAAEAALFWSEENGNNGNSSSVLAAENTVIVNEFFPSGRVYNYPNPVYEGSTAIRYYVAEDSKVNIKIFDLAGDFVAELNSDARGGFDNETMWDVSNIQSGIYLARVEAVSSGGKSEHNIIKIAVVK
jgi:hypothetical protein